MTFTYTTVPNVIDPNGNIAKAKLFGNGNYLICNTAFVWSCKTQRWLTPYPNGAGYQIVSIRHNGQRIKQPLLHVLVAEAHIPTPPRARRATLQVDHKDGNTANCQDSNLQWLSKEQHQRKTAATATREQLEAHTIKDIAGLIDQGKTKAEVARHFNITRKDINGALKTWARYQSKIPEIVRLARGGLTSRQIAPTVRLSPSMVGKLLAMYRHLNPNDPVTMIKIRGS